MNHGAHPASATGAPLPRLIAWEVTRSCLLNCKHCRAAAQQGAYAGELTLAECRALLDNIASFSRPTIILTGGEPMLRADIYDIAGYAHGLGLPVVMAPCGPLLNDETVAKILQSGIRRISLSLDGATAASHDEFRGIPGAFESVLRGIEAARRGGLEFQINTTVSQHNLAELPAILDLAIRLRAALFNPFLLVPTGRGSELRDQELSSEQYEQVLQWLAAQAKRPDMPIRVTCAPHYHRILRQMRRRGRAERARARRLPGRQGVRLHLASRERCKSAGSWTSRPATCGARTSISRRSGNVPALCRGARRGLLPRPLRRLRIPEALRRMPRARARGHGRLPGRGAVLHAPAARAEARSRAKLDPLDRENPRGDPGGFPARRAAVRGAGRADSAPARRI